MKYLQAIANGFALIHRNWQLVLIQAAMTVASLICLLLFVGIPAVAALYALGVEATDMGQIENLLGSMKDPMTLITRYMGLVMAVVLGALAYLTAAFSIWVYVTGGSAGTIQKGLEDPLARFSLGGFFSEARRLFFPLMGYTAIVGLIFIGVSLLIIMLGVVAALAAELPAGDSTIAFFLRVLAVLTVGTAAAVSMFLLFALSSFGMAPLVSERVGSMKALDRGLTFIKAHPGSLWLIILLIALTIGAQVMVGVVGLVVNFAESFTLSVAFQFLANVFQGYLALVALAAVLAHVHELTAETSTPEEGTSS